ncbi:MULTISPECIES: lytic polysaccharide monooxygenase [Actinoalloteichus]|uniref:Chitin binding domain-containing protein n=2 Tax=Actinoalloteichus cyanogriseus TaxID=2893586 RepID=A0ABT1JD39_ACTCY|nr:lytic polysaccharide monooxygenase [Actinoalloteichus caeruleus]MCP2330405.1 Chitin binding domain-containing protein [Actinoalloteichus caeruleus DSM 43889]
MRTRRRNVASLGVVGVALALLASTLTAGVAHAHGGMTAPATRTYVCFDEGPQTPSSDACRDAVAEGGTQPLWDWFAILIPDAAGRHREIIPDGELCAAGTDKYAAYNAARPDWPATTLRSGADYNFRYAAWAPHPGTFELYVTKDGYDPTTPLAWSDLEEEPFLVATDPPKEHTDGSWWDSYQMYGQLPEGKTGRHIIYSIWQRSDSPEAFYNCSDVVFQ